MPDFTGIAIRTCEQTWKCPGPIERSHAVHENAVNRLEASCWADVHFFDIYVVSKGRERERERERG